MSKLVVNSSLINWPIDRANDDPKTTKIVQYSNKKNECQAINFIEDSLKNNSDSWRKHLNNQCMCNYCNCGKHMCHLQRLKPLGKHAMSNYKTNYKKVQRIQTSPTKFEEQYTPAKGVVKQSTYHNDYIAKETPNKQKLLNLCDNLKVGGPFFVGTTYKQEYYPKISANSGQIRMLSNNIFAMNVPSKIRSSYHDNFKKHAYIQTQSFKPTSNLKKSISLDYTKGTTYKEQFKLPSIDAYKKDKYQRKTNPEEQVDHINKKSQYQSSFQPNPLQVCPAITQSNKKMNQ